MSSLLSLRMGHFAVAAAVCAVGASVASAVTVGTATITNAQHYGYFAFASTSQFNTKATVGPINGTIRSIRVSGTITSAQADAWASSIQVQPSGGGLPTYQPWFEFSKEREFSTVTVNQTILVPGGFRPTSAMTFEMFSLDSEQYVPGIDARSTLTYTFDDSFAPGAKEWSGSLSTTDNRFNRPFQSQGTIGGVPAYFPPELSTYRPYYDVQAFHVDTAGSYTIASANEFEAASALYRGTFDPANPLANILAARYQEGNVLRNATFNPLPFGGDAVGATGITYDLLPGQTYYFITTAFAAPGEVSDGGPFVGRYSNVITGAGGVTLGVVPEPAALTAMGALALATLRRR